MSQILTQRTLEDAVLGISDKKTPLFEKRYTIWESEMEALLVVLEDLYDLKWYQLGRKRALIITAIKLIRRATNGDMEWNTERWRGKHLKDD